MSNKIIVKDLSGQTMRACLLNDQGEWWNGSTQSFETYNSNNLADYEIALVETGNTGVYLGTFPAQVAAGAYILLVGPITGASLQESDLEGFQATSLAWTGTDLVDGSVNVACVSHSSQAAANLKSVFTGTGDSDGVDLSMRSLSVICDTGDAVTILSTAGFGIYCEGNDCGIYSYGIMGPAVLAYSDGDAGFYCEGMDGFLCVGSSDDFRLGGTGTLADVAGNPVMVNTGQVGGSAAAANTLRDQVGNLDAAISTRATPAQVTQALVDVGVTSERMAKLDEYPYILQPVVSEVQLNLLAEQMLVAYQYAGLQFTITVTDQDGNPIDLSGQDLAVVFSQDESPSVKVWEEKNYGTPDHPDELIVGGADNNEVTVTIDGSNLQNVGLYRWILRQMSTNPPLPLSRGMLEVLPYADASQP
ncbi:MAG: hypothetical protein JRI66_09195 [Deltaproteobacteria bacterium]|nr:hypothetical protein [Deltaproteobacteria bacterium]